MSRPFLNLMTRACLVLALVSLGACASTTKVGSKREVSLGPEAAKPAVISFPRSLDLNGFVLTDDDDLAGLVKMGLKVSGTHPEEAHRYFLRVAGRVPGTQLVIAALAAAAITALNAGDREGFLEVHGRLEEALGRHGRVAPPLDIADLIVLGNYMKGRRLPSSASPRLRDFLSDLERSK